MAGRRYHAIPADLSGRMTRQRWPEDERLLAFWLYGCEQRLSEGLFRLPRIYAEHGLGWESKRLAKAWRALERRELIRYDRANEIVLLTDALTVQQPNGPKQVAGAVNRLRDLSDSPLLDGLIRLADDHAEPLGKALRLAYRKASDCQSDRRSIPPDPDSDHDPDPDSDHDPDPDHDPRQNANGVAEFPTTSAEFKIQTGGDKADWTVAQALMGAAPRVDGNEALRSAANLLEYVDPKYLLAWIADAPKLPDPPRHLSGVVEFVRKRAANNGIHIPEIRVRSVG